MELLSFLYDLPMRHGGNPVNVWRVILDLSIFVQITDVNYIILLFSFICADFLKAHKEYEMVELWPYPEGKSWQL